MYGWEWLGVLKRRLHSSLSLKFLHLRSSPTVRPAISLHGLRGSLVSRIIDCQSSVQVLNGKADCVPDRKQYSFRLLLPYDGGQKLYRPCAENCRSISRKMAESILTHWETDLSNQEVR
jgi:hypothetical protein